MTTDSPQRPKAPNQAERGRAFLAAHTQPGCVLMPNAWDAGSARMLEAAGFPFILTTSAGIAFSLGLPDYGVDGSANRITREQVLRRAAEITAAVDVPVSLDLESGYGDSAEAVAETVRLAIDAGAVGGNIEDVAGQPLAFVDTDAMVERLRAARETADASGIPFVINARTDGFLVDAPDAIDESIRRGNRYLEAGANCVFVPGATDAHTLRTLVDGLNGPLSIVMGLTGAALSVAELGEIGVRRISVGGSLVRMTFGHLERAAREMREQGTFGYADAQLSQGRLNAMFDARGPR